MNDFEIINLTDKELADIILVSCHELSEREKNRQEYQLEKALESWRALHQVLREKGKVVGLNDMAEPRTVSWSDQPMVPLAGYYGNKPKTKREAFKIVKRVGYKGWATMGDLWLWLFDAGPIIEQGMQKFGYKFV